MTFTPLREPLANDWFDADLNWFMGHVESLALPPDECCESQGNYFVAGELHYFLRQPLPFLEESRSLLSSEQIRSIEQLRASVEAVPVEARSGSPTATGSLKDMQHPAWREPRALAAEVMRTVGPLWRERVLRNASR